MKEKLERMFDCLLILLWILLSVLVAGCEPITYTKKEEKLECETKVIIVGKVIMPTRVCKEWNE